MSGDDQQSREAAVNAAFERGDNQRGLELLRSLAAHYPDPARFHRQAVIEEQIGSADKALSAHLACLSLAPNNPMAYLYGGYCLHQQGRTEDALSVFSLGSDMDGSLLAAPQPGHGQETERRLATCNSALRAHFSRLHEEAVGDALEVARIRESVWVRTHDCPQSPPASGQQPHLFYVPGLEPIRYADTHALDWAAGIEAASDIIVQEFLDAVPVIGESGRPYLAEGTSLGEAFSPLVGSLNWTALDLYRDGQRNNAIADHFVQTLSVLGNAPLYGLGEMPFEVFFSVLKAGQHISPHYGLSNHSLTVHLPIIAPPNCELAVAGESRPWEPGTLMAFDDTFLHEAVNRSEEDRVVLIFSTWHPDLSNAERQAIQRSFNARQAWLDQRHLPTV